MSDLLTSFNGINSSGSFKKCFGVLLSVIYVTSLTYVLASAILSGEAPAAFNK